MSSDNDGDVSIGSQISEMMEADAAAAAPAMAGADADYLQLEGEEMVSIIYVSLYPLVHLWPPMHRQFIPRRVHIKSDWRWIYDVINATTRPHIRRMRGGER